MQADVIKLRPHHLLCTQTFVGSGYNAEFIANMSVITDRLRQDPSAVVEIVFGPDDICAKCPQLSGDGLCADNERIKLMDAKVCEHFGVTQMQYNYHDIIADISVIPDICGECSWYSLCAPESVLRN
jgi:hypothetical protein